MKNKGSKIIIIILVLVILGLIGYIVYDKVSTKEEKNDVKTETKIETINTLSEEEAISIGKDLYGKVKKIYHGYVYDLADNADDIWADDNYYIVENSVASVYTENLENVNFYEKYKTEISAKIKSLFTVSGLDKFLKSQSANNNGLITKDSDDNFYILGETNSASILSQYGLDEIDIVVNNIEENSVSFTVTDYWFKDLEDSEYNKNSSKAVKISNTFKIVKDNNTWKVEDYTDSYNEFFSKFLNQNS